MITEYFVRVMVVSNKLRRNGEDMPDSKIVEKILRTLIEKFMYIVVSIEESRDTDLLTVDELQSSLVMHELKFIHEHREDDVQVLKVEDHFGSGDRAGSGRGHGRGYIRGPGRGRGSRGNYSKATVECYKCHKLGHFQYECPKGIKEANYAVEDVTMLEQEDELLLMAHDSQQERDSDKLQKTEGERYLVC